MIDKSGQFISFTVLDNSGNQTEVLLPESSFVRVWASAAIEKKLESLGSTLKAVLRSGSELYPLVGLGAEFGSVNFDPKNPNFVSQIVVCKGAHGFFCFQFHQLGSLMDSPKEQQILDVDALSESVPAQFRLLETAQQSGRNQKSQSLLQSKTQQFLFEVGSFSVCVDLLEVKEVLRSFNLQKSLFANEFCDGFIHYRGVVTPVVFLDYFFNQGLRSNLKPEAIFIYEFEPKSYLAFAVHKLIDLINAVDANHTDEVLNAPQAISFKEFTSKNEFRDLIENHRKVYKSVEDKDPRNFKTGVRRTYIQFQRGNNYALEISSFHKVQSYADFIDFLNTEQKCLVINEEVIPILDGQYLSTPTEDDFTLQPSLVVVNLTSIGRKVALLVNSVDSLLNIYDGELLPFPKIMLGSQKNQIGMNAKYCVEFRILDVMQTVLILDYEQFQENLEQKLLNFNFDFEAMNTMDLHTSELQPEQESDSEPESEAEIALDSELAVEMESASNSEQKSDPDDFGDFNFSDVG